MNILYLLLPLALLLGFGFLAAFIFASRNGQYDDLDTPSHRMLLDDDSVPSQQDLIATERKFHGC